MKVKDLQAGQLYMVNPDPRVIVIVARGNFTDIVKARGADPRWNIDKKCIKGRLALYCGPAKVGSTHYLKGWYKAHSFLINGERYTIHGESMRNIKELA